MLLSLHDRDLHFAVMVMKAIKKTNKHTSHDIQDDEFFKAWLCVHCGRFLLPLLKQIFCCIICDECTDAANREHIYYVVPFTISDSVYGSTFFLTTGTHGMHVLVGRFFCLFVYLEFCIIKLIKKSLLG